MAVNDCGAFAVKSAFDFVTIDQMKLAASVNKHVTLKLSGVVNGSDRADLIPEHLSGTSIEVKLPNGRIYFAGIVLKAAVTRHQGLYQLQLSCISASFLLDVKPLSCSYQEISDSYEMILQQAFAAEPAVLMTAVFVAEQNIGAPIFRYQETTWAFALRMAGRLNTCLIADTAAGSPVVVMGLPEKPIRQLELSDYSVGVGRQNGYFCTFCSDQQLDLGDRVNVHGRNLSVVEKQSQFTNAAFENYYKLGTEQGFAVPLHHLPLAGLRLTGTVLAACQERLRLHLDIDQCQEQNRAFWFDYLPQTGNVMYAMPQTGTRAVLRFNSDQDHSAVVEECLHGSKHQCPERADYRRRYVSTEFGKRLGMLENALFFAGAGNRAELADRKGITVKTERNLQIDSAETICFDAAGYLTLQTPEHLYLTKPGSGSVIDLAVHHINIESRDTNILTGQDAIPLKSYPLLSGVPAVRIRRALAKAVLAFVPQHSGRRCL